MRRFPRNRHQAPNSGEEHDPLNENGREEEEEAEMRNRDSRGHSTAMGRRNKRIGGQAKTHPTIQAKHNQMYLITSIQQQNTTDGALINRMLPKELILRIFSFLDVVSLCRCAQTCRMWNLLALDGSNWQQVDLFTFQKDVKAPVIENLARRCGGFLKTLSLKGCENIQDSALRSFTAKCANIERLSLYKCKRVTDMTCENLGRNCHKLVHLNLENCTAITDRALRYIADGCKKLEYLNISWCDVVQDRGIQLVLAGCPRLATLLLKGCEGLTENVFNNCGPHTKSLVELNMLQCYVTDDTVVHLASGAVSLEYLCLSMCTQITDRALTALAHGCKRLTEVELSGCSLLTDNGFIPLAKNCKGLMRMDLEDCSLITDHSIHALANNCPQINELSLSHCELITDESIIELCATHRDTLEILELDNCPLISDSALSHMRQVRTLRRLDLYDCQNLSKEAINRFKQHRPAVEIHAYFAPATPPPAVPPPRNPICRCCSIL